MLLPFKNCLKDHQSSYKLANATWKKWCKNGQCDLCKEFRLVRLLFYTNVGSTSECFQIKSIKPKTAAGYHFQNLDLTPLVFPKLNFLEEQQVPAFCDFFSPCFLWLFQKTWRSIFPILTIFVTFFFFYISLFKTRKS